MQTTDIPLLLRLQHKWIILNTAIIYLTDHRNRTAFARTSTIEYRGCNFIPLIKQISEAKARPVINTCVAITPLDFIANLACGTAFVYKEIQCRSETRSKKENNQSKETALEN